MTYSIFLGAGFSKWAINLPLVSELFDFDISPFNQSDNKRIKAITLLKSEWDKSFPDSENEQFINYASNLSKEQRDLVSWYISRRLTKPFICEEYHAQQWRRHSLSIDEYRKFSIKGMAKTLSFLQGFLGIALAGILTTNYDLLVEYALGTKVFNYGINDEQLVGRGAYPVSTWLHPVKLTGKLILAKLHGSVSWDENGHYTDGRRGITGNATIVMPTLQKEIPSLLKEQWTLAENILEQSDKLLVFGFAFNKYDSLLLDLLKLKGKNIRSVLIIDKYPNIEAASELWPHAKLLYCLPPPNDDGHIANWKNSLS